MTGILWRQHPFLLGIPWFFIGMTCLLPRVVAQYDERDFTRYTVKEGLSDNAIFCLQQDDRGYIWIGTDAGLHRFDGHHFKKYYQSTEPLRLPSGSITRIKRFGPHQLGFITAGGFQLLNTLTYSVQPFIIPDSTAFSAQVNGAWDAVELPGSNYAVTTAAGFYVFNPSGEVILRHDAYGLKDIGKERILYGRDIFQVSDQRCLVYVQETGVAEYDDTRKSFRVLTKVDTQWNMFYHPLHDNDYWVVRQQMTPDEYLFITHNEDQIIYYHHGLQKKVTSTLPFHVADVLNWESKLTLLNDSTLALNHRSKGFYLLHLNRKTGQVTSDGKLFLPHSKIICLLADQDSRLWVGTTEGLLKQDLQPPMLKAYHYPPENGEEYTGGFSCVYRYKDMLYAGRFSRTGGLTIIRADNMERIREVSFFGRNTPSNEVRSIEMYHPDTLWLGTNAGIIWYAVTSGAYGNVLDEKKYPWAKYFFAVLAPARPDGYAWMCSMLNGKVVRYHIPSRTFTIFTSETRPALPFDRVKSIAYDAYGDVWIGGHSLARWNNRKQVFDTLITVYGGVNKFSDDIITLIADAEGSLWLTNRYNGLLEYRIKEKQFVPYSMKDGLPSDLLQALSPVKHQTLWLSANHQLALFDTQKKKFTIYDADDGFPEHRPTARRMFADPVNGMVYLCNNEYLVVFPFTPEESADNSSGLILEELTVDTKKTHYWPEEELVIQYNQNNLWLNYTVIDFEKSNYQFAYRLNHTGHWNVVGDQRQISLSNLPPGHYSIQLRASGKPGMDKTSQLFFVIRSPFWRTAWFISSVFVVLASGLYLLFRNRIRYIRQRANIDKLLAQTEIKALQAQMNPHFIFNSLNSIGEMILNHENKQASHYLSKFARLIRITLDQSSQSMVSLRNTIDYLERYMEMEHIRNSHFTHQIHVDEQLDPDETFVPPMLIQPFIENAIWHGVTASRKDIHVRIDFIKAGDNLVCKIDDNGIGIHQAHLSKPDNGGRHQPVGIANIQNRVALLNEKYNLHGHISIVDKRDIPGSPETGTRVTLQLPLEIEET